MVTAPWSATSSHYHRALPEEISVDHLVAERSSLGPIETLFFLAVPVLREGCGGAAFRLSEATLARLRADGLGHLRSALVGRGHRGARGQRHHTYEEWQPTPVPASWIDEGMWPGLGCMKRGGFDAAPIFDAAREPGSYFTSGRESELLVIPRLKLVVLTYDG